MDAGGASTALSPGPGEFRGAPRALAARACTCAAGSSSSVVSWPSRPGCRRAELVGHRGGKVGLQYGQLLKEAGPLSGRMAIRR